MSGDRWDRFVRGPWFMRIVWTWAVIFVSLVLAAAVLTLWPST